MDEVTAAVATDPGPTSDLAPRHQTRRFASRLTSIALRLAQLAISLVVVSLLVFLMLEIAPGDGASNIAGPEATEARIAAVRSELRLDEPVLVRYGYWLADAVRGDLGESLITHQPVVSIVRDAFPPTASLTVFAIIIATVLAFLLGAVPALWPDGVLDRLATVCAVVLIAFPPFWLAILLVNAFAVGRRWFPVLGYEPLADDPRQWFMHLVLPGLVLAAQPAGEFARQLRAALADVMGREFVLASRAKGLGAGSLLFKHGLKNAVVPVITVTGIRVAQLLGGTAIVETMFSINGLGRLTVTSVISRDVPVVIAIVVLTTLIVLLVNLAVEWSYGLFNPMLRQARRQ